MYSGQNDETQDLPEVQADALEYFAKELRRSGLYTVTPNSASTPKLQYKTEDEPPKRPPPPLERNPNVTFNLNDGGVSQVSKRPSPLNFPAAYCPNDTFTVKSEGVSRVPTLPRFSGDCKSDCEFDMWKYEISCLINTSAYPQHILLESIRKSLTGKARTVLLHLGEYASVRDIISELEAIYGNVATAESLKEQFYMARQEPYENVADYSVRLEQLLLHSSLRFDPETRNEMLRNRLWSGLRDRELKNASRYKFECIQSYNLFRRELRSLEQELLGGTTSQKPGYREQEKRDSASSNMSHVESKLLQQMEKMSSDIKSMSVKMESMEKELQELKVERKKKFWYKGNKGQGENSNEQDLNANGPSQRGTE